LTTDDEELSGELRLEEARFKWESSVTDKKW